MEDHLRAVHLLVVRICLLINLKILIYFLIYSACVYNGNDDLSAFYIDGCLGPVANLATAQTAGIAVINTCLLILAFVFGAELINIYPRKPKSDAQNNNKQQESSQTNNQEQNQPYPHQYGQYYSPNTDPNSYYNYDVPTNRIYL
jgi:hypothetical protein